MAVVRWKFDDPILLTSYTFTINPSAGGSPALAKQFDYANTSAQGGKAIVFQGRDQVQKLTFDGVILDQASYDAMVLWFNKKNQIKVTDDLGRILYVIFETFTPKRERAVHYPWKHSYSVTATIVNWT